MTPSSSVRDLFVRAGWQPTRRVPVSARVPRGHPAEAVLAAFGGLCVGETGPGIECAASDIVFRDADSEMETEDRWGVCLRTRLVCIGAEHNEHSALFIDNSGRVFGASLIHDAFYLNGLDFWTGVENALLGRRSQPLLHPTQQFVTLYGERYEAGDPRLFSFEGA